MEVNKFNPIIFEKILKNNAVKIEEHLNKLIPPKSSKIEKKITETMRYALFNGGKRIRAFIAIESCKIYKIKQQYALQLGSAIECMHAYSLVHDDLPSMDDDDLRRGLPTVHIKWDEPTAILTGDALQCKAFEILSMPETYHCSESRNQLINKMALSAGVSGMVSGQAADISAEKNKTRLNVKEIINLQNFKTGALIRWSAISGPLLAKADLSIMEGYSNALGLAFQIQDDILDVEGNASLIGKNTQKDEVAGKATFISTLGLEEARKKAYSLIEEACDIISQLGPKSKNLIDLANFVVDRNV